MVRIRTWRSATRISTGGALVSAADADVVEAAAVAEGDVAGVDLVVADVGAVVVEGDAGGEALGPGEPAVERFFAFLAFGGERVAKPFVER